MEVHRMTLTKSEIALLIEALRLRASRHDSIARHNPRVAGPHERTATAMRKLGRQLQLLLQEENAA